LIFFLGAGVTLRSGNRKIRKAREKRKKQEQEGGRWKKKETSKKEIIEKGRKTRKSCWVLAGCFLG
jgi:hypothetical protein